LISAAPRTIGCRSIRRNGAARSSTGCTGEPVVGSGHPGPRGPGRPDPPAGAGPQGPAPDGRI